jgi:hypothetical protein
MTQNIKVSFINSSLVWEDVKKEFKDNYKVELNKFPTNLMIYKKKKHWYSLFDVLGTVYIKADHLIFHLLNKEDLDEVKQFLLKSSYDWEIEYEI